MRQPTKYDEARTLRGTCLAQQPVGVAKQGLGPLLFYPALGLSNVRDFAVDYELQVAAGTNGAMLWRKGSFNWDSGTTRFPAVTAQAC